MLCLILSVKCKQSGYRLAAIDFKMEVNDEGPDFLKNKKKFVFIFVHLISSIFLRRESNVFFISSKKINKNLFFVRINRLFEISWQISVIFTKKTPYYYVK